MVIIGNFRFVFKYYSYVLGRSVNLEKLDRADWGVDGTFVMRHVTRKIGDKIKKFTQIVQLVRKVEKKVTKPNGREVVKNSIDPLFIILLTSKKTEVYCEMWKNFIDLHLEFYPDRDRLLPGTYQKRFKYLFF